jgi:hypothetical protein
VPSSFERGTTALRLGDMAPSWFSTVLSGASRVALPRDDVDAGRRDVHPPQHARGERRTART